jgi:hypothetical protein
MHREKPHEGNAMKNLTHILTMGGFGLLAALASGAGPAQAASSRIMPEGGATAVHHVQWRAGDDVVGYYRTLRDCERAGQFGERTGNWDDHNCSVVRIGIRRGAWALQVASRDDWHRHGFGVPFRATHGFPNQFRPVWAGTFNPGHPGHPGPGNGHPGFPGPGNGHSGPGNGHSGPGNGHSGPGNGHSGPGNGHSGPGNGFPGPGSTHTGPGNTHTGPGNTFPGPGSTHTGPGNTLPGPGNTHTGPGNTFPGPGNTHTGPGNTFPGPGNTHTGPGTMPQPGTTVPHGTPTHGMGH